MDVVLMERVDKLGQMGDVVAVRPGYARNFLIPQGKALRATRENVARFEAERADREARNLERRDKAEGLREGMEGIHVTLIRQAADNLQLYGSVKARDIADSLIEQGFEIDRRNVALARPIKTLGLHEVVAMLHPEVSVTITANVARTEEEAVIQKETGRAVGRTEDDEAAEAADAAGTDSAVAGDEPAGEATETETGDETAGEETGTETEAAGDEAGGEESTGEAEESADAGSDEQDS